MEEHAHIMVMIQSFLGARVEILSGYMALSAYDGRRQAVVIAYQTAMTN